MCLKPIRDKLTIGYFIVVSWSIAGMVDKFLILGFTPKQVSKIPPELLEMQLTCGPVYTEWYWRSTLVSCRGFFKCLIMKLDNWIGSKGIYISKTFWGFLY